MRVSEFCLVAGAVAAIAGMGIGIHMGISQDFALAPAHAHLNLLGWVTMALYGLYHRGVERRGERLAWVQAGCGAFGSMMMAGGLATYLATGGSASFGMVVAGSLLSLASMLLFLVIVLADARQARTGQPAEGGAGRDPQASRHIAPAASDLAR